MAARAARASFGLPEPMDGWSWTSLDDREFLEFDQLDALAATAAREAAAPALAFSVHDSDSVYLVGTDTAGRRFRLVVNAEALVDELVDQEVEEAVGWAREHGPLAPSSGELADVLARRFVFAEEGLDVLLARMGLLPPEAAEGAEELDDVDLEAAPEERRFDWNELEALSLPDQRPLPRGRWYATLAAQGIVGQVLAAEQDMRVIMFGAGLDPAVVEEAVSIPGQPPIAGVAAFVLPPGGEASFYTHVPSLDVLSEGLAKQGAEVGEWHEIPDDVPRDLAATAAWVAARTQPAG